ncbi:hypothetical protein VWM66_10395, partial [Campylobacter jejuni]
TALGAAIGSYSVLFVKDEQLKLIILIFLTLTFLYTALRPNLGIDINDLESNFKLQLQRLNNISFSPTEWESFYRQNITNLKLTFE